MMRKVWLFLSISALAFIFSCRGDGSGTPTDGDGDTDIDGDADSDADGCNYPAGPYAFERFGVVGPMNWPSAVPGADEPEGSPNLAEVFCDPEVHSVFIQVTTTVCSACPARMQTIGGLRSHWETYGARWIFLVADADSSEAASDYADRNRVTFGWRSNDADNTLGMYSVVGSDIYEGVPWTAVIRTSDMQLVYDEPEDRFLDIMSIARELANSTEGD
jgi:hypothetical protein